MSVRTLKTIFVIAPSGNVTSVIKPSKEKKNTITIFSFFSYSSTWRFKPELESTTESDLETEIDNQPNSNELIPPLNIKNPVSDPEPEAQSEHDSESEIYFRILNVIKNHKLILNL